MKADDVTINVSVFASHVDLAKKIEQLVLDLGFRSERPVPLALEVEKLLEKETRFGEMLLTNKNLY